MEKPKYHFRRYHLTKDHPFLVALIVETSKNGKEVVSGFNLTHSVNMVLKKPYNFIAIKNPNPKDDAESFLCTTAIRNKPINLFSQPIKDWKLSKEDELIIDKLVNEKLY